MRGVEKLASVGRLYRGDWCLFFLWSRRLFCKVFPFPVCRAQFIGDWYENRRGAQSTIIFLTIRQYYWRTDAPCANSNGGPNTKKNPGNIIWILLAHSVWSALPIGGGDIGAPISTSFGAPHLFSYQSPIKWALQTGNRNTLKKRWRLH
jgi:hypothetical protein